MDNNNSEVVSLYLDDIIPNRFQPREVFDDQALKELAVSIKEHGVIQPIIVRKVDNKYEIIAGERRYKASTMAGLTKIPAIVKDLDDKESSKIALIENLQRKDLSPIEEARTYQKILELEDNMTQEQLAATMGKTQSSVSNKLRLLALPEEIQDALLKEKVSERHARSLLNLEDKNDQIKMLERIISEKMTVRELDKAIKEMKEGPTGETGGENDMIENTLPVVTSTNEVTNNILPQVGEEVTATDIVGADSIPQIDPNTLLNNQPATENVEQVPTLAPEATLAPAPGLVQESAQMPMGEQSNIQEQTVEQEPATTPAFQTFNLASFSSKPETNTEPETSAPSIPSAPSLAPTEVDINKIRENSVDIGGNNQQTVEVNELMKDPNQAEEEFKFVPSFDFNDSNSATDTTNNQLTGQPETVENKYSSFFSANLNTPTQQETAAENSNLASSITSAGLTIPNNTTNVETAATDIKNTVESLKQKGYNVSYQETNGDTNYTITINIAK